MRKGLIAVAATAAALSAVPHALGAAFTVNSADDVVNGACDVTHCSLREAIIAANTSADVDVIGFAIFAGPQTIAVTSPLPGLTGEDTINGSTQPGYSGAPIIELDGSGAGATAHGLVFHLSGLLRAVVVNDFGGDGVHFNGGGRLEGSYIGTDITGTVDHGNGGTGVRLFGTGNIVGGTGAGEGNVISGNGVTGITVENNSNEIRGNVIGLNAAGTAAIGNCIGGVRIFGSGNTVGGLTAGARNVISGNQGCAVAGWAGVTVYQSPGGNTIQGNLIGTNSAGTAVIASGDIGVRIMGADNNQIGGTAAGAANVITGPTTAVDIGDDSGNLATGNAVLGNYIGTNAGGADLGAGGAGVVLTASDNSIGDAGAGGNVIAHNNSSGVAAISGVRNRITGNSIFDNTLLGIDLGADGVTPNDAGDTDTGANNLQNFPVLTSAELTGGGGDLEITGTYSSAPSTVYRLEFFYSSTCDSSGNGEGQEKRGFVVVTTNGSGTASFSADSAGGSVAVGGVVTATAIDPDGNSSEFSACRAVTTEAQTFTVNSAAEPGDGTCDAVNCTLRDAVDDANAAPTDDVIEFAIGTGPQRISLTSRLLVMDTLDIAGETQPGYAGVPLIELDGSGVTANPDDGGIELFAGAPGSRVTDLVLNGFQTNAIGVYGPGNTIEGNYIGTNAAGTGGDGNRNAGIYLQNATNTTINGNVIASNEGDGIRIIGADGTANTIVSNRIGMDVEGEFDGNLGAGISIEASGNTVGPGNVIVDNGSSATGIRIESGVRNKVTQNDIRSNLGLGIDLGPGGVTPNDTAAPPDSDTGANNLQNFPTLETVSTGATTTTITGTMTSTPDSFHEIELFSSPACDGSGHGEGQTALGSITMTTGPTGGGSWSRTVTGVVPAGHVITATATDALGNTSEFSVCLAVASDVTEFTVNSAADPGDGTCNAANCTLREAINAANLDPGLETIRFSIGSGPVMIEPTSALPVVTQPVVLDATTQPVYSDVPLIRLDGGHAGPSTPGIEIHAGGTTVRGFSITNFTWDGVKMRDGDGNTVEDNWLGVRTNGDGIAAAGNGTYGVLADFDSAGNVIRRNVIGGNGFSGGYSGVGIWHAADDNVVEDNDVGVAPGGLGGESLPNAVGVIISEVTGTRLSGNRIANSTGTGVWVFGSATSGNAITANRIDTNGGLGIDLADGVVTPNDGLDADTGANGLQNFPVISAVDGEVIQGTLQSKAALEYRLEFFSSAACDPSGNGEGARFLGAVNNVQTGETGNAEFSTSFASIAAGEFVTATATDPNGDTSEFSSCFLVPGPAVSVTAAVTIAPQAGSATVMAPARVELEDVPAETFIAAAKSTLEPAPLGAIPLGAIPLGAIPLGAIPLGAIGFNEPQIRALLGGVALSTVPLTPPKSWSALLQPTALNGLPLQSISLKQALDALAAQPAGVAAVPLGAIGLRGSELGSLTPEAVGLGVAPLGAIGIGEKGTDEVGDTNLADWCEWLSGPPVNCTNPASLQTESVLSTSLRGAPLGAIPLGAIPLGAIPLGAIPLGAIPLGAIDVQFSPLGAIPLGAIPLGAIPLGAIPLGAIPLGAINLQQSPLGAIPLGAIPLGAIPTIFTCTPSCPTSGLLRDHVGQLKPNLTLEQLMRAVGQTALGNITFADVLLWVAPATLNGLTVRQFVETLLLVPGNDFTFADLLAAFLADSSLGWERLNLDAAKVNTIATATGTAHYAVGVTLTPDGPGLGTPNATVATVTLPAGFAYVPGSSALDDLSTPAPASAVGNPAIAGDELTWTLPLTVGPTFRLTFDARPRSTLGPAQATVEADPASGPVAAGAAPATVTVADTFEANNDPAGPLTTLQTSSFYLSYITGADDVDFYSYPVPPVPGTRVTFNLSHLEFDADIVVYGPNGQILRDPRPGTEPLDGQPLDDKSPTLTSETDALEQQTLSDLALANLPVLGVGTLRSNEDDAVMVVSDGTPGNYVVQVTGFNGGSSPEPYMLRPAERAPVALPTCQPRSFANAGTNSTSLTRGTVPAVVDTVFVVNKAQWERVHGAAAVASALTTLDGQMAALAADGHPSAILQVDADPDVQPAVAAWNACPTELTRANTVMREVGRAIDVFRAAHVDAGSNSTVQNIVLLGGDEVIPAARLEDRTTVANEDGYAETFASGSELSTTLRLGYFLSDDPYGDVDPIPFFDRQLHIPDVPVGRLPTTPAAAARAVVRFTAFDGRLAPVTAATSGYDFLTDGAQQVDAALRSIPGVTGANPPGLIGNTWNKASLLAGLLPGGVPRDLLSINGHADHRGVQPAAGTALFEIGDLPPATGGATEPFDRKLVFSMGCHAGLSVSEVFVVSPLGTNDWPQAYTQRGGTYAGSSGFAYGDGKLVAYSEDLHRRFAEHIGGLATPGDLTIGQAIVLAKQDYFGELGVVGVYDEKASSEFTLYGLPMWQIGGPAGAAAASAPTGAAAATVESAAAAAPSFGIQSAPTAQELVVEPATGLTAEQLTADWTPPLATPVPGAGSYVVGKDGVQVTHFRPVEPKTVLPVTVPSAHGALITELSSSSTTPFDPYFARPIVASTAIEPLLDWDRIVHPAKLQTVTTSKLGTRKLHRLVLVTGQFSGPPGGGETGTQRLFPHIEALVFSTPSNDHAKPILGRVSATSVGPTVAFSVETRDLAPNGPNDVVRVRVGYLDQPDGGATRAWKFVDLVRTPSTDRWSGAGPLVSANADFLYFVQAVDRAGNVAVSTNKGIYYEEAATPPPAAGGLSITAPAPPANGWYGTPVQVTVRLGGNPAAPGDNIRVDVDGGGFQPYTGPVTVTGDGSHTVTAKPLVGPEVSLTVLIDTGAPQIVIASPASGAQIVQGSALTADFSCLDAGAGVAPSACVGTVANGAAINTSAFGPKTFKVDATDRLGKTATKTISYTVVRRSILFASSRTGFGDIYAVGEGGGAVTQLTTGNAIDAEPARSPDGSRIAFTSTRHGNIELYSMKADGTDVVRLTTHNAIDTSPAWSPDGTKIVFSSNRTGNQFDIWVMNANGTAPARLTTNSAADLAPAWSPNGLKIAFQSTRTGGGDIYTMNPNGTAQTPLTTSPSTDAEPDWSPDGTKIAFSTNRDGSSNFEIYSMTATGGSQTRLTNNSALENTPNWSADGLKLAFTSTRNGNLEVYVMMANGSGQTRVTNHSSIDATPDW